MSSIPTPASFSRCTAAAIVPLRSATGTRSTIPSSSGRSEATAASAAIAASASPADSSVTSRLSPPTWSFSSSEVPSAITLPWSITEIRSASRSASSRYWVVSSTVVPSATRPSIVSQSPIRLRGSSPVVGSSRKSTGGRATSAAARSSRRRIPPE